MDPDEIVALRLVAGAHANQLNDAFRVDRTRVATPRA